MLGIVFVTCWQLLGWRHFVLLQQEEREEYPYSWSSGTVDWLWVSLCGSKTPYSSPASPVFGSSHAILFGKAKWQVLIVINLYWFKPVDTMLDWFERYWLNCANIRSSRWARCLELSSHTGFQRWLFRWTCLCFGYCSTGWARAVSWTQCGPVL